MGLAMSCFSDPKTIVGYSGTLMFAPPQLALDDQSSSDWQMSHKHCNSLSSSKTSSKDDEVSPLQGIELDLLDKLRLFSYEELKSATWNFHAGNKIGRGGFGVVYKGVLKDGTQVAIKSLSIESKQAVTEFLNEIVTISNIHHQNLVVLVGCCVEGENRMLVYEYLENNSLTSVLMQGGKHISIDWQQRVAICMGVARCLTFLHEEAKPRIIHRDIKASNVLLDKDFNPKIGDFGLAKLFPDSVTHISTRVAGTMGYLAPEYVLRGKLTRKADVYSFGVLILEIVSGSCNTRISWGEDMKDLLEWAWSLRDENRLLDLVDKRLVDYPKEEVLHLIKIALCCTQASPQGRPSMKKVVHLLSEQVHLDVDDLLKPYAQRVGDGSSVESG